MKKDISCIGIVLFSVMLFSCSQNIFENTSLETHDVVISDDFISKKYYTKDLSQSFSNFFENSNEVYSRVATGAILSEEESLFLQMWSDLTESEKEMLQKNLENIEVLKRFFALHRKGLFHWSCH